MSHFRNSRFSSQDHPNYGTDFQELKKARKLTEDILSVCSNNEEAISGQISALIKKHQNELILEKGAVENRETRNQIRGLGRKLESLNRGVNAITRNSNRGNRRNHNQLGQGKHILRQRNHDARDRYRVNNNTANRSQMENITLDKSWTSKLKCGGNAKHTLNTHSKSITNKKLFI